MQSAKRAQKPKTAWGIWVAQERKRRQKAGEYDGVLVEAQEWTGLSWSTVSLAQKRRVRADEADLLGKFTAEISRRTGGTVLRKDDIAIQKKARPKLKRTRVQARLRRRRAA